MKTKSITIRIARASNPDRATSVRMKEEGVGKPLRAIETLLTMGIPQLAYRCFDPEQEELVGYLGTQNEQLNLPLVNSDEITNLSFKVAALFEDLPILLESPIDLKVDSMGFLLRETKVLGNATLLKWYECLAKVSKQAAPGWRSNLGGRYPACVCLNDTRHYVVLPPLLEIVDRISKLKSDCWPKEHGEIQASSDNNALSTNYSSLDAKKPSNEDGLDKPFSDEGSQSTPSDPNKTDQPKIKEIEIVAIERVHVASDGVRYRLADKDFEEYTKRKLLVSGSVAVGQQRVCDLRGRDYTLEPGMRLRDLKGK